MYTVYVIKSLKSGKKYVGFTSKSVAERLKEHNRGCNKWIKENKPFKLLYYEDFKSEQIARKRERFFKTGKGREVLTKLIPA